MPGVEGKVAIVTGAGGGIGEQIARRLAEAGVCVAVADIDSDRAESISAGIVAQGGSAFPVTVDVSRSGSVREMVRRTVAHSGGLHILVNNAGIIRGGMVEDMSEEDWRRVLDVNLTGAFLCAKAAVPILKGQGWGRIVNVASIAAKRISFHGGANYTASKAGLLGLTRHLAFELAAFGITVNAICPGPTFTPMVEGLMDRALREKRALSIPGGEFLDPRDHAEAVLFLVSPQARRITGVALEVDGGALTSWISYSEYEALHKERVRSLRSRAD